MARDSESGRAGRFRDRADAARQLAARLAGLATPRPVVLAIPRGAVPMGRVLADALGADLDVVLVHKVGAPGHPEFAVGSVDERGRVVINPEADSLGLNRDALVRAASREIGVLRARRLQYGQPRVPLSGRVVILLDDGIATGSTMLAAIRAVRDEHPGRVVVATAVAPPDTLRRLAAAADEVVCLHAPAAFVSVGQWFDEFPQVSDAEVTAALAPA